MAIQNIENLITNGLAYTVETYLGVFVCLDYKRLVGTLYVDRYDMLHPQPVDYPIILDEWRRTKKDCVLWAPYVDGIASPWGPGLMTVNTLYLLNKVFNNVTSDYRCQICFFGSIRFYSGRIVLQGLPWIWHN